MRTGLRSDHSKRELNMQIKELTRRIEQLGDRQCVRQVRISLLLWFLDEEGVPTVRSAATANSAAWSN